MQVCNNVATDEIDDHRIQSDYNKNGNIQKERTLHLVYCVCVVKTHDTNDNVTTKTQNTFHTKHMNIDTWSECARSSLVCFVGQVLVVMIVHHIVAQVSLVRVISCSSHDERISSTLSPPFPSTSSSSHSSLIFCTSSCTSFHNLEGSSNTAYFALKEMDSTDDSYLLRGYEPKSYDLMESYVEFNQSLWPSNGSPSNGSSKMWITMTPRSKRCFITHTEYMFITPSEKACLSVSRPRPSERGDPLESEQGDRSDQVVKN